MGILKYGLAVALGYVLGRPEGRERLGQVGRRVAALRKRPEAADPGERPEAGGLGEHGAGESAGRHRRGLRFPKVRRPFSRSRDVHFPPSDGPVTPSSLGGTTVMEDSEAAVLGTPVTPRPAPSTTAEPSA